MKKLIRLTTVLVIAIGFMACGGQSKKAEEA